LDAAFYAKAIMQLEKTVRDMPGGVVELGETAATLRKGIFDIKADSYTHQGVPLIRISNLRDGLIDDQQIARISPEVHAREKKTQVSFGDLALSKTAYPASSFVQLASANVSQDVIAYKLDESWAPRLNTPFLVSYLNSRAGKALLWRQFQGNVQLHLSLDDAGRVPVPLLRNDLQNAVRTLFQIAMDEGERAKEQMRKAEDALEEHLGLKDWRPEQPLSYIRTANEVLQAGRIDAAYFNPDKSRILERLSDISERSIGDCLQSVKEIFVPDNIHAPFRVRNFDLPDAHAGVLSSQVPVSWSDELGSSKKHVKCGDVVISRLRSYLKEIAVVRDVPDAAGVVSTEFVVLRPKNGSRLTPEAVWGYLRSWPVQFILRYCVDGSQHPRFSELDLLAIPMPAVVGEAGPEISLLFSAAEIARQRSERLLRRSTDAIDIGLEQGEDAALAFLRAEA
jgi:hypothetical protein